MSSEEGFDVFELTFQVFLDVGGTAGEFRFGHFVPATFDQATVVVVGGEGVAKDGVDGFGFGTLVMVVIEFQVPEKVFKDGAGTVDPLFRFHCGDSVRDSWKKVNSNRSRLPGLPCRLFLHNQHRCLHSLW